MTGFDYTSTPLPANGVARSAAALAAVWLNQQAAYAAHLAGTADKHKQSAVVPDGNVPLTQGRTLAPANQFEFNDMAARMWLELVDGDFVAANFAGKAVPITLLATSAYLNNGTTGVTSAAAASRIPVRDAKAGASFGSLSSVAFDTTVNPLFLKGIAGGQNIVNAQKPDGSNAMTLDLSGNVVFDGTATAGGKTLAYADASNFAPTNLLFTATQDGRVSAAGAGSLVLSVAPFSFIDVNGNRANPFPAGTTVTIVSGDQPVSSNIWIVLYYDPVASAIKKIKSAAEASSPIRPGTPANTILLGDVFLRPATTGIYTTDQGTANTGYLLDSRTPYVLDVGGGGGGGLGTYAWANSDAGITRNGLGAAQAGANADILSLNGSGVSGVALNNITRLNGVTVNSTGTFQYGPTAPNYAWLNTSTSDSTREHIFQLAHTGGNAVGGYRMNWATAFYEAQNTTANQATLGAGGVGVGLINFQGDSTIGTFGASGAGDAFGSVTNFVSNIAVQNVSVESSEFAPYFGVVTFNNNNNGYMTANGLTTVGRGWMTDFSMHGAIAKNQSARGGINMYLNNYFDGSPHGGNLSIPGANKYYTPDDALSTLNPSYGYAAMTGYANGGQLDSYHAVAGTYPNDVGFHAAGSSGDNTNSALRQGWRIAFLAGGKGTNWNLPQSRIGWGLWVQDFEYAGIYVKSKFGGTGSVATATTPAIAVHQSAGGSVFGGTPASATPGTMPQASSWVQVGNVYPTAAQQSPYFAVNGPSLGAQVSATAGTASDQSLASFSYGGNSAFSASNNGSLGLHAQRIATGTANTYLSVAAGLTLDVDATARAGAGLWWAFDPTNSIHGMVIVPAATAPHAPTANGTTTALLDVGGPVRIGASASALPIKNVLSAQVATASITLTNATTTSFVATVFSGMTPATDLALASPIADLGAGLVTSAEVISATTVRVTVRNDSGASQGPAVFNYRIMVFQF